MQHEHQKVPVTALVFLKDHYILSGEGPYLNVYSVDSTLLKRKRVLQSQAIHGINFPDDDSDHTAIVWGGRWLRVLQLKGDSGQFDIVLANTVDVEDWILDAAFAPSPQCLVGLVTAHNAFLTLHVDYATHTQERSPSTRLSRGLQGSNTVLYAAHLQWLSPSHCLIASGTSFGDIIVWSALFPKDDADIERQTHYIFAAHEGSVFGLQISKQLALSSFCCTRMLASCSDDRTVKLWDISSLGTADAKPDELRQDTGFGGPLPSYEYVPPCLTKSMGHISRIWHVRYADAERDDEVLRVLSFGEDATVITWILIRVADSYTLSQCHGAKLHSGKNIWAVARRPRKGLLATGGADGSIALYIEGRTVDRTTELPFPVLQDSSDTDVFRVYAFIDDSTLLSTTEKGRVVLIELSQDSAYGSVTEVSAARAELRGYSVTAGTSRHAFIGGIDGTILSYSLIERRLSNFAKLDAKVAGLFAYSHDRGATALLATSVGSSIAQLFLIQSLESQSEYQLLTKTVQLQIAASFIVTSFAHHQETGYSYAVLGCRSGSIALYSHGGDSDKPLSYTGLKTEAHGKEAVNALRLASNTEIGHPNTQFLFSTGRDGTFAIHKIRFLGTCVEFDLVHQLVAPFGPNIEGLHIGEDGEVIIWGFKSKHFIAHDLVAQRELFTIECGGAHRNWAYRSSLRGGRLVWTKALRLFQAQQTSLPYDLINSGGHGREIKAVAISSRERGQFVASGSEDTDIKLWRIEQDAFTCLQTLRKHNTGIQHLAWNGRYLFSSGGFEEFFVWRTTPDLPFIGVGVQCESVHPRSGTSDLRVTGFDVQNAADGTGFVITMAYSDSTLRTWQYRERTWTLIARGDYLTSCLTYVATLSSDIDSTMNTAATDGHIAQWTLDDEKQALKWVRRHRLHQSAIHEMAAIRLQDGASIIVTGGDDNALGLTRVESTGEMETLLIARAHAAAVTGLAILPMGGRTYCLASAGVDQRVRLWRINVNLDRPGTYGIEVQPLHSTFTAVADVSSLNACTLEDGGTGLLVCGVGMDLWRLPL